MVFIMFFFSLMCMFLLLKCWERLPFIASVLLSLSATSFSWILLIGVARGVVIGLLDYQPTMDSSIPPFYSTLVACIQLALTYAVIQSLFFIGLSYYYPWLHTARMILIAFLTNAMAAILVYKLLPYYY